MKKLLLVWVIIALLFTIGLTYIGINLQSKYRDYYELEENLTKASKEYLSQFPDLFPSKELVLTSEMLIDSNYLIDLNIQKEKCTGYTVIKKEYISYKYKSYVSCNKYETSKYNTGLDGSV